MKSKYMSMDDRTGYKEEEIVELTREEFESNPFAVKLRLLEPVDDKVEIEEKENKKELELFKKELSERGLSKQRVKKVMEKYSSLDELKKKSKKAGIDELTDEWVSKEFGSKKEVKEDGVQ